MKHFTDKWEEANRENLEGLSYIDDGEHKLFYRFTPSKTNPVGAPLFIVLHGHGTKRATRFQKEGWNILSPVDHFGYEGKGCWWLGENGNFFVRDLLQRLIRQISQEYQCEDNIYFYGSSMGGYGAILHGTLCNARAVYANVPQIKLLGTIYSERMMKRYFSAIFDDPISEENDLTNLLLNNSYTNMFPVFYLCENIFSEKKAYENYLQEHTDSFIKQCKKNKIKFHLELLPKSGHDKNYGLGEVCEKFERFTPPLSQISKSISILKTDNIEGEETSNYNIDNEERKIEVKEVTFQQGLWFFKDISNLDNIKFENGILTMDADFSSSNTALYVESCSINLKDRTEQEIVLKVTVAYTQSNISVYVVEYNSDNEKVASRSYRVRNGYNRYKHIMHDTSKTIKLLFRFDNDGKDTIVLSDIALEETASDRIKEYISTLHKIDKKHYLLINFKRICHSSNFRPRKDIKTFKINLPLNWDVDPFNDNNWMFQLHALRLLDTEIAQYISNQDEKTLKRIVDVILDWKRDVVDEKKNFQFDKKEEDSFAWHDMATGLRAMKIAFALESVIKLGEKSSVYKSVDVLIELAQLHIDALSKQKPGAGNHAIFQTHGLMMLLRLFPNDFNNIAALKTETEQKMLERFYQQFFKEGIHKENSANYHSFILNTFEKILTKEVYPDITEVFSVVKQAQKNCAYMHFPNLESLMTGDSDYQIVTPRKEEHIDTGITHFEESGYTYVYEDNDTPSMLFFDTAFLNRSHRHADFFNVLLYEYGKNILVDAGKYSYQKENPFRQYCISTRAHNTVLIDNQDYRLDRKFFFASRLKIKEQHEHYYHLMASNDYTYMKTSHERHIFYRPQEFLLVVDLLRSEEARNFKQIFHLHQDLELSVEGAYLKTEIDADTPMYIQMQSLDIPTQNMQSSLLYSRGLEGEIEGYRALGHNEIVENHVLINEAQSSHLVLGTMFSFGKKRDIQIDASSQTQLHIYFDQYTKIIGGENNE